jgi:diketogulonate reductase-like aldo/keto reductase
VKQRVLGPTKAAIPVIGQGTWNMERDDRGAAIAALQRGIDAGMTHIDTAEMYGAGAVEALVGEALRGRREQVYLVSKVLPSNGSRRGTIAACKRSLRYLRTDYLDLYLLHWPGRYPLEETFAGFDALLEEGLIRAFGISNFTADEVDAAVAVAGAGRIACNQVCYHLRARTIEHFVIPRCQEHGIAVVGYSPFGSGEFPGPRSAGGRALAEVAAAHGATPYQIALAFLTRFESCFTIPKTSHAERAAENAAAGDLELTEQQIAALEQAFPLGPPRHDVPII